MDAWQLEELASRIAQHSSTEAGIDRAGGPLLSVSPHVSVDVPQPPQQGSSFPVSRLNPVSSVEQPGPGDSVEQPGPSDAVDPLPGATGTIGIGSGALTGPHAGQLSTSDLVKDKHESEPSVQGFSSHGLAETESPAAVDWTPPTQSRPRSWLEGAVEVGYVPPTR